MDFDRDVKAPLYAGAGVPETWLVDLPGERIEVHRDPGPKGYREVAANGRGAVLRPLALPELEVPVDAVLS